MTHFLFFLLFAFLNLFYCANSSSKRKKEKNKIEILWKNVNLPFSIFFLAINFFFYLNRFQLIILQS